MTVKTNNNGCDNARVGAKMQPFAQACISLRQFARPGMRRIRYPLSIKHLRFRAPVFSSHGRCRGPNRRSPNPRPRIFKEPFTAVIRLGL